MFESQSSDRYPHLAPLTINKRAGPSTRAREHATASITSNSSLSPNGSFSGTNIYSESASAASVAAGFIAEVDTWIMDIRQQLDELEERHAVHREWLANGGADDPNRAEGESYSDAESKSNEENDVPSSSKYLQCLSVFSSLIEELTCSFFHSLF